VDILEERVIEYIKAGPRGEEAHWEGGAYNSKNRLPLITRADAHPLTQQVFPPLRSEVVHKLIPNSKLTTVKKRSDVLRPCHA